MLRLCTVANSIRSYDVLSPIIQNTEGGRVEDRPAVQPATRASTDPKADDTQQSLQDYAVHLLGTLEQLSTSPTGKSGKGVPDSPTKLSARMNGGVMEPAGAQERRRPHPAPTKATLQNGLLTAPASGRPNGQAVRGRKGSFLKSDDELVENVKDHGGPREAVEILSRNVSKSGSHRTETMRFRLCSSASYDIAKDGDMVAVLTLIKTTYRLGETVLGVVAFNSPGSERHVLKVCLHQYRMRSR